MSHIIEGKLIAQKINTETKNRLEALKQKGVLPHLGVILVGNNPASVTYDRTKEKAAKNMGMDFTLFHFDENITESDLIFKIQDIQKNNSLSGLIIQLPLPEQLYTPRVLSSIAPSLDVDCLTEENLGKLFIDAAYVNPPTPQAVLSVIDELAIDLKGKNVTLLGAGALVGKPLAVMLMNAKASVTTINSSTNDVKQKCLAADIIVTGVGKRNLLTKDMVSEKTIVIDTGFVFENGKSYGDVDFDEVSPLVKAITPTPGGIGPITVAHLLRNTIICAEKNLTSK